MKFRIKIGTIILLLFPLFSFSSNKILWEIGSLDKSYDEFALSDGKYKSFVPSGFGGEKCYFVVGKSDCKKDWPYVLPGSLDHFIGASFWAGRALCKLPVYFKLDDIPQEGNCQLCIYFIDVAAEKPPLFRAKVNGNSYEAQLKGGSEILPIPTEPKPQKLVFDIPVSQLKKGVNEIEFCNLNGSWAIFDAIQFWGPKSLKVEKPANTLIRAIGVSEFETVVDGNSRLPLMLDVLHKGNPKDLVVEVDGEKHNVRVEEGHSIMEINLASVDSAVRSKVQVFDNHKKIAESFIEREAKNTITPADYVNQFMGTSGSRWMINPGPWMPMGMVKISPDNEGSQWKSGYEYQIENIMGFSHVHEWMMAGLLMMPTNGDLKIQPGTVDNPDLGYRSRIDKKKEMAKVGCYSVDLTDYDIHVDITATKRASMQRYLLPKEKENRVVIDLHFPAEYIWQLKDAEITRVSDTEIEGWAHSFCNKTGYAGEQDYKLHFVIQFDQPMKNMGGWVLDRIFEKVDKINKVSYEAGWAYYLDDYQITDAGAFVNFEKGTGEVKVRTGISLVSIDQARLNLTEEIVKSFDWNFEAVVENQKSVWNKLLGTVEIETNDRLLKEKFYSNMYRALCPRNTWSDVNGKWVDMNEEVQETNPSKSMYGSDGYWGWHWNLVSFYNLLYPEISSNWLHTFAEMYNKGGWLPIGNPGLEYVRVMVGQPAIPLIVSAYQHGIRDFDVKKMFEAIYHQQTNLMEEHPGGGEVGNESYKYYLQRGYVPINPDYQSYVSNTLEYAYQDWCVSQFAKVIGKDSIFKEFESRAENWRHIFDPQTKFMRPRNMDGSWLSDFDPYRSAGFCESNSWQYTWYVPHNLPGLINEIGREDFVERLTEGMETSEKVYFNALGDNFTSYPINHGNQSNMQSCYLFNYAGKPWLTQKWARAIQQTYYGSGPRNAYPGDEDQGQMSSWYVMSTIGLFQMDGGCSIHPMYEIGSPLYNKVTLHLDGKYGRGKEFVIESRCVSKENKYIQKAILNGRVLNSFAFPTNELLKGGELILEMGPTPNYNWGTDQMK